FVVKRSPGYGDSADDLRSQMRNRRESPCAPHLHRDVDDLGYHLPRRILERNGPTRRLCGKPETPLLRDTVDLEYDAVDFILQRLPLRLPFPAEFDHLVDVVAQNALGIDFEAMMTEPLERFPM